jgi:hypothetical protein
MLNTKIGNKNVEVYDSIDLLPIKRFHKFNKYLLIDAGIGSDINDINDHVYKIMRLIDLGDKENSKKQLENLRQSLYLITQETNIKHLSFMVLIKSIDGKPVTDISDTGMKKLLSQFNEQPKKHLDELIEFVKKKIDEELNLYFPGNFDDIAIKEYYDRLRQKILLQLDGLIRGTDNSFKIDKIDEYLLNLAKPKTFSGKDSIEIKYEKQFEEMCLYLKKELNLEAESSTTLQFYNAFEYLKKINKQNNGRQSNKI